jgi:hypothetical protein
VWPNGPILVIKIIGRFLAYSAVLSLMFYLSFSGSKSRDLHRQKATVFGGQLGSKRVADGLLILLCANVQCPAEFSADPVTSCNNVYYVQALKIAVFPIADQRLTGALYYHHILAVF